MVDHTPSATPATRNGGDVVKCHACHAKRRWPSAPPEPAQCHKCHARPGKVQVDVAKMVCERWCVTKLCVKDGVWQSCAWKRVCVTKLCERWCVWQSYVCKMVCDKVVWKMCERWCVCVGQSCVWKMVCDKVMWKRVCDKAVWERWCVTKLCVKDGVWQSCGGGGGGGGGGGRDGYRIKNKNPTQRCGEKHKVSISCSGFLPNTHACKCHAAITLRFAASRLLPACLDAHDNKT